MDKNLITYLAFCQKSGNLVTGEDACVKAIATGKAKLVLIAEDASDNTKKKFTNKALYYRVPSIICKDRDFFSKAIGKNNRPTLVITEDVFAEKISGLLKN